MAGRKQVIFCTDGIFPHSVGGMQRHSALLIEELAKSGSLDLVVIHPHEKEIFPSSLNITEIPLNFTFTQGKYLLSCYRYSAEVEKVLNNFPGALIYSQGLSVWKGIKKFRNRIIVNPHGLEPYQTIEFIPRIKAFRFRLIINHLFRNANKIISLGGRLTKILNTVTGDPAKIAVIPNAVHARPKIERNFNKEVLQLLFVGRFNYNKGIHILMQAVEGLNNEGYKNRLIFNLAGKGPLFEQYKNQYSGGNINFLGFTSDEQLEELYKTNDLFVFPTLYEGMPTVVLEAMSAGMPVVVSDTGATAELVDTKNGFLIEKNNVRSLKWAIQTFYQMSVEQRNALSDASYNKVMEKFTWPQVAARHLELFNTLTAGE